MIHPTSFIFSIIRTIIFKEILIFQEVYNREGKVGEYVKRKINFMEEKARPMGAAVGWTMAQSL